MSKERKRSIESAQAKMRMLNFKVESTATTPVAASFDRFQIDDILDLGVGNYTIIFKLPFERDCLPVGHCMFGTNATLEVVAVAYDRVTVQIKSGDVAAAADVDFSICIAGSDSRFDY